MSEPRYKSFDATLKEDGDDGVQLVARFSTFDIPDRDGDVVRATAFKDGQSVPMVWAHQWDKPIGKGIVRVEKDHARFEGTFFSTATGQEARTAIKEMGDLQQYSWGFRVLETQPNKDISGWDITKAEVFEVSPVLVGANQQTATIGIKQAKSTEDEMRGLMEQMRSLMERAREMMGGSDEAKDASDAEVSDNEPDEAAELINQLERERLVLEAIDLN